MEFEYDELKSESNKVKHGIDFEEAQAIWADASSIQLNTFAGQRREERFLVVGDIDGIMWTAVVTFREQRIRIISVRRARDKEIDAYDNSRRI